MGPKRMFNPIKVTYYAFECDIAFLFSLLSIFVCIEGLVQSPLSTNTKDQLRQTAA